MSNNSDFVDSAFEYNAPQFVDFTNLVEEDDTVDDYFNVNHENIGQELKNDFEESDLNSSSPENDAQFTTPASTPCGVFRNSPIRSPGEQKVGTPLEAQRVATPKVRTPRAKRVPLNSKSDEPESVNTPKASTPQAKRVPLITKSLESGNLKTPTSGAPLAKRRSLKSDDLEPANVKTPTATTPQIKRTSIKSESDEPQKVITPRSEKTKRYSVPVTEGTPSTEADDTKNTKKCPNIFASVEQFRKVLSKQIEKEKASQQSDDVQSVDKKTVKRGRSSVPKHSTKEQPTQSRLTRSQSSGRLQRSSSSTSLVTKTKKDIPKRSSNATSRSRSKPIQRPRTKSDQDKPIRARTRTRTRSANKDIKSTEPPVIKSKLTMPTTPPFMKRKTGGDKVLKTSEEMQLDTIRNLRKDLDKKRKIAEDSCRKALKATSYVPVQSKLPVTKPEIPHFATDTRIKATDDTNGKEENGVDFAKTLRSSKAKLVTLATKSTIPQPFNLHERKRKADTSSALKNKFISMAETEKAFFQRTPDRFRSKPKRGPSPAKRRRAASGDKDLRIPTTEPHTPCLATKNRKRNHHIISQNELDEQEVEDMKKNQFKAHPVNEKIFQESSLGVKKMPKKEPTKPQSFDLETYRRNESWDRHKTDQEEEKHIFHAKPVPHSILKGPTGIKPVKEIPNTVPESPAFALKNRVRPQRKPSFSRDDGIKKPVIKDPKAPVHTEPFQVKLDHHTTAPKPFSFEERNRMLLEQKEKRIQKELEESKMKEVFHANPLPDLSPHGIPQKKKITLTIPEPFHLEADERGAKRAEEWSRKIKEDLDMQKKLASFKAQPPTVIHKEPFKPKPSNKALTDISDIELNTDKRAIERAEFEKWKKQQEEELERQKEEAEKLRQEEEELVYQQMRKDAITKANPVRKYKGVDVQPSNKLPTIPVTPRFSERLKSRVSNP